MYLFLDRNGCVTDRNRAVDVVYGLNEWVREDIEEYGTNYCCRDRGSYVECRGMRGARIAYAYLVTCIDRWGRIFIANKDNGLNMEGRLPLACLGRYKRVVYTDEVTYALKLMEKAVRIGCGGHRHCIFDDSLKIVAFSDDVYDIVDKYMLMARHKVIGIGVIL
jgi:hypothetical protein